MVVPIHVVKPLTFQKREYEVDFEYYPEEEKCEVEYIYDYQSRTDVTDEIFRSGKIDDMEPQLQELGKIVQNYPDSNYSCVKKNRSNTFTPYNLLLLSLVWLL